MARTSVSKVTRPTASRWLIIKYARAAASRRACSNFEPGPARVSHAPRRIEDQVRFQVRLFLIFLDEISVALAVGPPVDVADLVAGAVLAVLGELNGEPLERAPVQARHHPLDGQPRQQFEPAEAGQGGGVERGFGVGIAFRIRSRSSRPRRSRRRPGPGPRGRPTSARPPSPGQAIWDQTAATPKPASHPTDGTPNETNTCHRMVDSPCRSAGGEDPLACHGQRPRGTRPGPVSGRRCGLGRGRGQDSQRPRRHHRHGVGQRTSTS